MLLLAHAGHWALWVLYALPVVIVVWSIAAAVLHERRREREDDSADA